MTIEIDDSGTADLLGNAFIGFWRRETNDLVIKTIPLELYQQENYNEAVQNFVKELFISVIEELRIPTTEEIYLSRGDVFTRIREWLRSQGYNVFPAIIEGYLQKRIEDEYKKHLREELYVSEHIANLSPGESRFSQQISWVEKDFPRRKNFVKSGFPRWKNSLEKEIWERWLKRMVDVEKNIFYSKPAPNPYVVHDSYNNRYRTAKRPRTERPYRKHVSSKYSESGHRKKRRSYRKYHSSRRKKKMDFPYSRREEFPPRIKYSSTNPDRKKFLY